MPKTISDTIYELEQINKKPIKETLSDWFQVQRITPEQIQSRIKKATKQVISLPDIRQILRSFNLVKKVKSKWYYNKDDIKIHKILAYYGMNSSEDLLNKFYFSKDKHRRMSVGRIADKIYKDSGIRVSRQAIWRWIYENDRYARSQKQGFNLGVDTRIFNHNKVAGKIDYKNRNIDYKKVQQRRLATMNRNKASYGKSEYAPGLKNIILKACLSTKDISKSLDVSMHTVKHWVACYKKVNKIYWKPLCKMLNSDYHSLFEKKPTKLQQSHMLYKHSYIKQELIEEELLGKQIEDDKEKFYAKYIKEGRRWIVNLKDKILAKGLSIENLAKEIKMDKDRLNLIIDNQIMAKPRDIERIAAYLNVRQEDIASEKL